MALARAAGWRPQASWLVPLGFLVVVLGTLMAVIVLSQHVGKSVSRPDPPSFVLPAGDTAITRFDVKQAGGGKLTLAVPPVKGQAAPPDYQFSPGAATRIEVLRPMAKGTVPQPGDWVSVIGITNEVRNFTIHSVVVVPDGGAAIGADHVKLSPGGFAGDEAAPNGTDQVILGGTVERVDGMVLTLTGPAGPIQVQLTEKAPLFRLETGTVDEVRAGDSVASNGLT
ncbi:MAG: hypothetical protein ABI305_13470, partial [Tepidiformaceae bacterium]